MNLVHALEHDLVHAVLDHERVGVTALHIQNQHFARFTLRKHFEWPTRAVEVNLARPFKGINILDASRVSVGGADVSVKPGA